MNEELLNWLAAVSKGGGCRWPGSGPFWCNVSATWPVRTYEPGSLHGLHPGEPAAAAEAAAAGVPLRRRSHPAGSPFGPAGGRPSSRPQGTAAPRARHRSSRRAAASSARRPGSVRWSCGPSTGPRRSDGRSHGSAHHQRTSTEALRALGACRSLCCHPVPPLEQPKERT